MYKIKRYTVLNDLELMLSEQLDVKTSAAVGNEIYQSIVELIVNALNSDLVDPYNDKELTLADRVDRQFKEQDFDDYIRIITFEYVVHLAEDIRFYFIKVGCPRFVKYRVEFSRIHYNSAVDLIKIDFETTSYSFMDYQQKLQHQGNKEEDIVEDNPSLELLNDHYNIINKETE